MKRGWWKPVAVLCLILQVGFLAAGMLHVAARGADNHRHDGREHACPAFPHVHLSSPEETRDEHHAHTCRQHGKMAAIAGTSDLPLWATPRNVLPCPSEHCLICSLSDLVRSSDFAPAGELVVNLWSARCPEPMPASDTSRNVLLPCLPRGPPVVG